MTNYYSVEETKETNPDHYFMQQAILEAHKATKCDEVPVGAVIVCKGRIIARGHNLTETLTDVTAHAEMQAITAATGFLGGKYLTDCTLYVTLEPCVMCAGALGWSQISRIVYGASDEKRGYKKYAPHSLHPKTEVLCGVLEQECSKLLKDFFKKKRNLG
jgi:tRNA(adenine34) deaminase